MPFPILEGGYVPHPSHDFYSVYLTSRGKEDVDAFASIKQRLSPSERKELEIIFNHSMACESELSERYLRADFFWTELKQSISSEPDVLFSNYFLFEEKLGISDFIEKIIIPFHAGFYNHYITLDGEKYRQRSALHLGFIKEYIRISGTTQLNDKIMIPFLQDQLNRFYETENWKEVIKTGEEFMTFGKQDDKLCDQLINGYLLNAMSIVSAGGEADLTAPLQIELVKIEALKKRFPYRQVLLNGLGRLYHYYSVVLANNGKLPEALAANYRALAYRPDLKEAHEFTKSLREAIGALQEKVRRVEIELRNSNGTKRLTLDGYKMISQAKLGFTLAQGVINSGEKDNIEKECEIAIAASLWIRMGLAKKDNWVVKSISLLPLWTKFSSGNFTLNEIYEALSKNLDPIEYPYEKIASYWLGKEPTSEELPVPIQRYYPYLPTEKVADKDQPPLLLWLYSKQDLWVKVRMAAAVLALAFFLVIYSVETIRSSHRNSAFNELRSSTKSNDNFLIIKNAKEFLSNLPIVSIDERDSVVQQEYKRALVKYVIENRHRLTSNDFKILR